MIAIFSTDRGTVAYVPSATPAIMRTWSPAVGIFGNPATGVAITRFEIGRSAGVGLTQTLGYSSYAMTFSERLGSGTLTGLVYSHSCTGPVFGMNNLNLFYLNHSMSLRALPFYVTFMTGTLCCYLMGGAVSSVQGFPALAAFSFKFVAL